jgi:hypothetical protein
MSGRQFPVSLPRIKKLGVFLLLCVATGGCNRSGLNLAPVEGVVKLNGAPVEGAGVLFMPSSGPFATGTTDAEGKFTLTTANEPGAIIGDHRVIITKTQTTATQIAGERLPRYNTKHLIPTKYGDLSASGLAKTVVDDDNKFEFNLN